MSEYVSIRPEEYARLLDRDHWLACLEAAGVDNWDGYSYARAQYLAETDEDDE